VGRSELKMPEHDMLNLQDAADMLGVSKVTLRRMTERGEIPCYRIGTRQDRRFRLGDLSAYLAERRSPGAGPAGDSEEYRFD
jgi:excisionase family DNA binding protein